MHINKKGILFPRKFMNFFCCHKNSNSNNMILLTLQTANKCWMLQVELVCLEKLKALETKKRVKWNVNTFNHQYNDSLWTVNSFVFIKMMMFDAIKRCWVSTFERCLNQPTLLAVITQNCKELNDKKRRSSSCNNYTWNWKQKTELSASNHNRVPWIE